MGATFPLFAKVDVVGPKVPDAWSYLISKSHFGFLSHLCSVLGVEVNNAWLH